MADEGPDDDGEGSGAGFDDRLVTLATTLGGAGVIHGNLTPECAEFVKTDCIGQAARKGYGRTRENGPLSLARTARRL